MGTENLCVVVRKQLTEDGKNVEKLKHCSIYYPSTFTFIFFSLYFSNTTVLLCGVHILSRFSFVHNIHHSDVDLLQVVLLSKVKVKMENSNSMLCVC